MWTWTWQRQPLELADGQQLAAAAENAVAVVAVDAAVVAVDY